MRIAERIKPAQIPKWAMHRTPLTKTTPKGALNLGPSLLRHDAFQWIAAMLILVLASCAPIRRLPVSVSPIVRIGIQEKQNEIAFEPLGPFRLVTKQKGEQYRFSEMGTWLIKRVTGPAANQYRIHALTTLDPERAHRLGGTLKGQKIAVQIDRQEQGLFLQGQRIVSTDVYRVFLKQEFSTAEQARQFAAKVPELKGSLVVPVDLQDSLVLVSPSGKQTTVHQAARISGTPVRLSGIKRGQGFHFSREESRTFGGEIEFRLNMSEMLVAINVLPLEDYLEGVLPAEMIATFPLEALKAQAIAARTFFLHNFGKVHLDDPFDFCADIHCQAFLGVEKTNDRIRQAIAETRGWVLTFRGDLCSTPYSAVCGGHTENSNLAWDSKEIPYLSGLFDLSDPRILQTNFDLSKEDNVRAWVESQPRVHCNIAMQGTPDFASYAEKYFRWIQVYHRSELEKTIKEKTGEEFGTLHDLVPISRGVSGRLIELEVVGSNKTFRIRKELNIRRTLSPTTLYSACFVVDKSVDASGEVTFTFKGAGWGHGVGMCQIGAAMQARDNKKSEEILRHYYQGAKLERYY